MQLEYLSKTNGIGGRIKEKIEDFAVEEIMTDGTVLEIDKRIEREQKGARLSRRESAKAIERSSIQELSTTVDSIERLQKRARLSRRESAKAIERSSIQELSFESSNDSIEREQKSEDGLDFVYFVLQKKNWNTMQAINAIANALHVTKKRFNYAGNKDRRAVTTQLVSAFKVDCEKLAGVFIKDIRINGCWKASEKVDLGDLNGNRFVVVVRGACSDAENKIRKINEELNGFFPNYFGEQRFGSMRCNTHLVGKAIVQGNFGEAVENYLVYSGEGEEVEEARQARERLKRELDYKKALGYFPNHLKYERTLLAHLAEHSNDYVNALRKLPRGLNLMFVHAYQSLLFNELLSERVKEMKKEGKHGLKPEEGEREENGLAVGKIIGSNTLLNEREKKLFEREGMRVEAFKIPSFPEIGSKGSERLLLAPVNGLEWSVLEESAAKLQFSLESGSYATVLLREFMDSKDMLLNQEKPNCFQGGVVG